VVNEVQRSWRLTECEVVDAKSNCIWLENTDALTSLQAHRVIPHRRWVFSAMWKGHAVFAKVFLGKQAEKYAARDAQGARWMLDAKLVTPSLLWQGVEKNHRAHILIYQAVQQAQNAEELYKSASSNIRLELLKKLVTALAQQHAAGLVQTDLHLKNFIVANGSVWAIDGDGIRQKNLSRRASYQQLAVLISKLFILDQQDFVGSLVKTYQKERGWVEQISPNVILAWANSSQANTVREYVERKIFRNCTDVVFRKMPTFIVVQNAAVELPALAPDILQALMHSGRILKAGNTSTVIRAPLAEMDVVVKRYNIKNWRHALSRAWRPSRAAQSWSNAFRLQYHGFLTPQPLAMLEQHWFGLRGEAYFVSALSALPDAFIFFDSVKDKALRQEAIRQLALTCYQFYLLKISHGDLKATNLQINVQGQIVVMDLDSMKQHRCAKLALRAHVKDIRRLLQNWKDDTSLYNALLESFNAVYVDKTPLKLAGISI
jgi:tRNA A-37 threonylcarbamoyl transferase component Bud32